MKKLCLFIIALLSIQFFLVNAQISSSQPFGITNQNNYSNLNYETISLNSETRMKSESIFGIKIGYNYTSLNYEIIRSTWAEYKSGVSIGAFYYVPLMSNARGDLSLQLELLFSEHGYEDSGVDSGFSYKSIVYSDYIILPIIFKPMFNVGKTDKIGIGLGVGVGFHLSTNYDLLWKGQSTGENISSERNSLFVFLPIGISYDMQILETKHLIFDIRENLGLTPTIKNRKNTDVAFVFSIGISL